MPHCFKLARRLSQLRLWLPPTAVVVRHRLRLFGAVPALLALASIGCTEDQDLTAPVEATDLSSPTPSDSSPTSSDTGVVVVTDSVGDGIDSTLASASTGTTIYPGQNIQAVVNSYPGGTTFTLKAGLHRLQAIVPKAGDTFLGEPGTILSGAVRVTTFLRQNGFWIITGQTQQGERRGGHACDPAYPRCDYPEQLFVNDVLLKHVGSLAAVRPGTWYFDYAADRIYMVDDPTGKKVETSVAARAFDGPAGDVKIRGLTIEKYANSAGRGVIGYIAPGPRWVVENNEIRSNFGVGIKTNTGLHAVGNKIHHQGHMGISGSGDDILVADNEISYNNTAGFTMGWEAGATKFTRTNRLIVRGNFSHHNHGPGLWTDIGNINTLYENNRVEDNDWRGIFHEISYAATIRNNICRRNGFKLPANRPLSVVDGAGILVSNSPNVQVYGNTVEGNRHGIAALESDRGSGPYGVYDVVNLNVHDNTVVQPTGRAAGIVQNVGSNAVYTSRNNRFVHNIYDVGSMAGYNLRWMNADRTWSQWRSYGLDVTGTYK